MKTQSSWPLVASTLGLLASSMAQGATYYVASVTTTELPTFGVADSGASDINNAGFIVGWSKNPVTMRRRAVIWKGGPPIDLGTSTASMFSYARGINDAGEVVGQYGDPDEFNWQAFYWSPGLGVITLNRSLYPGEPFDSDYIAQARAINVLGTIAGQVESRALDESIPHLPCHRSLPVRWSSEFAMPQILHCTEVGDGPNGANDINNLGWIVGSEANGSGPGNGFVWKTGVTTHIPVPIFGSEPSGSGINESGAVVGSAKFFGGNSYAIRWDGASASSSWIGALPGGSRSYATEINDQNFVSGSSEMQVNPGMSAALIKGRAFLWHSDFGLFALPVPGGMAPLTTDCSASALNNRLVSSGVIQVVGGCGSRAVRWTVRVLARVVIL